MTSFVQSRLSEWVWLAVRVRLQLGSLVSHLVSTRTERVFLAIAHLITQLRDITCINLISQIRRQYKGNNSPRDYNPVFVLSLGISRSDAPMHMSDLLQLPIQTLVRGPERQATYRTNMSTRFTHLPPRNGIQKRHAKKDLPPASLHRCKCVGLTCHASSACSSREYQPAHFISLTS